MIRTDPKLKDKIRSLYQALASAPSLAPSPTINQAFTELVELAVTASNNEAAVMNDPEIISLIPTLQAICAKGESCLESYWAGKIADSRHPDIALENFPYYHNYLKLTELEYRSLSLIDDRPPQRVLFVGSGPLPLSAILLAQRYGLPIDGIDHDAQAVQLSTKLVNRLRLDSVMAITKADAATYTGYHQYDTVFLASLVGLNPTVKQAVIGAIQTQMKPGGLLIVRTAHGLRRLLYPSVDMNEIQGFQAQVVIQPLHEVINSIIILKKPCVKLRSEVAIKSNRQHQITRLTTGMTF